MPNQVEIERSLRDVWSRALSRLRPNRSNKFLSASGLLLGAIPLVVGPVNGFYSAYLSMLDLMSQVIGGILGFVITGFVLAVTVVDRKMVKQMWSVEESYSKFPTYKVHVLEFIRPIIYLFLGLSFMILGSVFCRFFWPTFADRVLSPEFLKQARPWYQVLALGSLGWVITSCLIRLKAFGFNVYQYALVQVRYWLIIDDEPKT